MRLALLVACALVARCPAAAAVVVTPSDCKPKAGTTLEQCDILISACRDFSPPVELYWLPFNPCDTGGNGCQYFSCQYLQARSFFTSLV